MDEQKDTKYQTHLSGPTQGFVQGEHNTVIVVSKEPEMDDPTQRQTLSSPPIWIRLCCWLARQRGLFWGTAIFGIVLNFFATWLVTPWGSTFSNTPLGTLLNHFWISLGIGVGLLAVTGVVTIVSRQEGADPPQTRLSQKPTQQNRSDLARALHQEYRKQLEHSLQGAAMIAVGLHERTDVIRTSTQLVFRRLSTAMEHPLPFGTSIIQVYDDAERGLLILGEPGAGKTTLLLELACELLSRAKGNAALPIPVILNLSSWASKEAPLQRWLIDQLRLVYGIPPWFSQAWLDQDQWLLLLDGLDEVEETSRQACVEAINAYREGHFIPLVVCSRSNEYLSQDARVALSNAVVVQPLGEIQVNEYLKRLGKSMAAVRAVVRGNPTLRQLITTPLMLHIIILAYRDKTIKDLPQLGSPEEQQRQIFDCYVQRMLELQTTRAQFTPQQTRRWLIWLAQQMKRHHLSEFHLEWLQPSWLMTKRTQIAYRVFSGLGFCLVGVLAGVLVGGEIGVLVGMSLVGGLVVEMVGGLVGGLVGGEIGVLVGWQVGLRLGWLVGVLVGVLVFCLVGALVGVLVVEPIVGLVGGLFLKKKWLREIDPVEVFTWSWKNVWQSLVGGLFLESV